MKKGISAFVATVLLVGFTVAVGVLLSVWFTTFTRTQTAGVEAGTACAANPLYVRAIGFDNGNVTALITNGGSDSVNVTTLILTCGGSLVNTTNPNINIAPASQVTTWVRGHTSCTRGNIGIFITAACSRGGTTSTACPEGTCFS